MHRLLAKIKRYIVSQLNPLSYAEKKLANVGERLVPKTPSDPEVVRHKSSYLFFKKIIEGDRKHWKRRKIRILDLGCGVGHGCVTLSRIQGAEVTGIDNSREAILYAQKNFNRKNIKYAAADIADFLKKPQEYDYVVSRGVLEHIPRGLELARKSQWRFRLIFDVPYNEKPGPNPHHLITRITEKSLKNFLGKELFYEDLDGRIFNQATKPEHPNMILCVASAKTLPPVGSAKLKFPVAPWRGNRLDS